ncbi:hypothetical protein [Chryseobacterium elymi]|uniref:hypothetical protein n=1 Tax=Chryseobacterium elymi TaxID=395936 RepID=UPI000F4FA12E|nr:hypothetical protein [Chryseobacterium elymi]
MKNLKNLKGVRVLGNIEQKEISGGRMIGRFCCLYCPNTGCHAWAASSTSPCPSTIGCGGQ